MFAFGFFIVVTFEVTEDIYLELLATNSGVPFEFRVLPAIWAPNCNLMPKMSDYCEDSLFRDVCLPVISLLAVSSLST